MVLVGVSLGDLFRSVIDYVNLTAQKRIKFFLLFKHFKKDQYISFASSISAYRLLIIM